MKKWFLMIAIWLIVFLLTILLFKNCGSAAVIGKSVESDRLVDGVYRGSYKHGLNEAEVEITIQNQKIMKVEILKHDAWKGKKAEPVIPNRIVEKQSTKVEAVSGATNSSNVIMNAVQNAIEKSYLKNQMQ
jgi:uncharacterized protein with FMN-binding domain